MPRRYEARQARLSAAARRERARTGQSGRLGWCILRTGSRNTLALAQFLTEAGIETWAPSRIEVRRLPRRKDKVERTIALLPSYVFARATGLSALLRMAATPGGDHPEFSVFRYQDRVPVLADADLESLRTAETREQPKAKRRTYRAGESVRIPEGSFAGMTGVVEEGDGRFTLVCFGGRVRVKISTFLLRPEHVDGLQSNKDTAAEAA
jgi:transcription antitermination factor NusG